MQRDSFILTPQQEEICRHNEQYRQYLMLPKVEMPVEKPRPPLTAEQQQERAAMMANHALRNALL